MKTIYKYPLAIADSQAIKVPGEAKILCVQLQMDTLTLWAQVDPNNIPSTRTIEVFGTGHPMDDGCRSYIGTVQEGSLVWHVFERHTLIAS